MAVDDDPLVNRRVVPVNEQPDMAVNLRQKLVIDLHIASRAAAYQNLLVFLHVVTRLELDAVSLHLAGANDVLQLQGRVGALLEVTAASWQQRDEDVRVADVDKHVVLQSAEAAGPCRRHDVLKPVRQATLAEFKLLEDSEADLKVADHVIACGDVVLDVELAAYVRVALHVNPIGNDEVIDNLRLPLVALIIGLLVHVRAKVGEAVAAGSGLGLLPLAYLFTEHAAAVDLDHLATHERRRR